MPLSGDEIGSYPEGVAVNADNVHSRGGCSSVLQTYVLQANGRIGACCGLGMRSTPELNVGVAEGDSFLESAIEKAEDDYLKLWIRYKGPERILAWAAEKNPEIAWEGQYAHRCQACMRVYQDPRVAAVLREHYRETLSEVTMTAWLDEEFTPKRLEEIAATPKNLAAKPASPSR